MKYYKYSFKCKKCGLVVYATKLSGNYIDECCNCESKKFKIRYLADFVRLFIYLFKCAIDKIKQIFWPAVLVIGGLLLCGGFMYSIYWFNKSECDRVHNLGYETDFDFSADATSKSTGNGCPSKSMA